MRTPPGIPFPRVTASAPRSEHRCRARCHQFLDQRRCPVESSSVPIKSSRKKAESSKRATGEAKASLDSTKQTEVPAVQKEAGQISKQVPEVHILPPPPPSLRSSLRGSPPAALGQGPWREPTSPCPRRPLGMSDRPIASQLNNFGNTVMPYHPESCPSRW